MAGSRQDSATIRAAAIQSKGAERAAKIQADAARLIAREGHLIQSARVPVWINGGAATSLMLFLPHAVKAEHWYLSGGIVVGLMFLAFGVLLAAPIMQAVHAASQATRGGRFFEAQSARGLRENLMMFSLFSFFAGGAAVVIGAAIEYFRFGIAG